MNQKSQITCETLQDNKKNIQMKDQGNTRFQLSQQQTFDSPTQKEASIEMDETQDIENTSMNQNVSKKELKVKKNQQKLCLKTINQNQLRTQETNTTFQSPKSDIEESKENMSECNSTSTKHRRSGRYTTDSKAFSFKTGSLITSPSQNTIIKQRVHDNDNQLNEHEPPLRKKIYHNFVEDNLNIKELQNQNIQNQSVNNYQFIPNNNIDFIEANSQIDNISFQQKETSTQNYHLNSIHNKDTIKSQIKQNQIFQQNSESIQKPENKIRSSNFPFKKINFESIQDSEEKSNEQLTLIFQQKNKVATSSIKDEIDGQYKTFKTGNLHIQVCQTDDHYPQLFNQEYLDENYEMIKKKQCNVRQTRRLLTLDTVNSIQIEKDNSLLNLLDFNVIQERNLGQTPHGIVEYEQTLRPQPLTKKQVSCRCKRSKCLKLYCECFNQGETCSPECNCTDCSNTADNEKERENAMKLLLERNPDAFKSKIKTKIDEKEILVHNKGCNCKKSECQKKYCECYDKGVLCSEQCKCEGCKNCDPSQYAQKNIPRVDISSFNNYHQKNNNIQNGVQYSYEKNRFQNNDSSIHHNNFIGNPYLMRHSKEDMILNSLQHSKNLIMNNLYSVKPEKLNFDSENIYFRTNKTNIPISNLNFQKQNMKDEMIFKQNFYKNSHSMFNQRHCQENIQDFHQTHVLGGYFNENNKKSNIYLEKRPNSSIDKCMTSEQNKNKIKDE